MHITLFHDFRRLVATFLDFYHRKHKDIGVERFMRQLTSYLCLASCLVFSSACASKKSGDKKDGELADVDQEGYVKRLPDDTFDPACCNRVEVDLNGDVKPDAYEFNRKVNGRVVTVRKEVDINRDSKIDLIRLYNDNAELVMERIDVDFDGRVDVVNIYGDGKLVRKEYDTNFDKIVDVTRHYKEGKILRVEADHDLDGRVDYWEYYDGGKLDRAGVDSDGDGEVDQWSIRETAEEGDDSSESSEKGSQDA